MTQNEVRIISNRQIQLCGISPADCIRWVDESFRLKHEAQLPAKVSVHPREDDFFTTMPALLPARFGCFGVKVVSRIEGGKPSLKSDIMLYESQTGRLLAIVDGDWITAMRTGAVAALAIQRLKSSQAKEYSLMGLGNIARAVVRCLLADEKEPQVRFRLLRYKDQAEQLMADFADEKRAVFEVVDQMEDFVAGASVLISCITAAGSCLLCPDDSLYQKGVLVVPVHTKGFQNCDLTFDKVFGDDTAHVGGFKYFSQFRQYAELGSVLIGKHPGRESDEERILSYNVGLGLHDVLFAKKIYDRLTVSDPDGPSFIQEREDQKYWI